MNAELKKRLSILELSDLVKIIECHEADIKLVDMNFKDRLELILDLLAQDRENRLIARLVKNAGFKYPMASLESLDYDSRQIKKSIMINLADMGSLPMPPIFSLPGQLAQARPTWHVHWASRRASKGTGLSISECRISCITLRQTKTTGCSWRDTRSSCATTSS